MAQWGRRGRRKADCAIWNCWWMRITIARGESAAKYGGGCMDRWLTPLPLLFFPRQATFPNYAKVTYGRAWRLDLFASPSSSRRPSIPTRRGFTFLNWFPPSPQAMRPRRTLSHVIRDYADTLFVFNVLFRSIAAAERHWNF